MLLNQGELPPLGILSGTLRGQLDSLTSTEPHLRLVSRSDDPCEMKPGLPQKSATNPSGLSLGVLAHRARLHPRPPQLASTEGFVRKEGASGLLCVPWGPRHSVSATWLPGTPVPSPPPHQRTPTAYSSHPGVTLLSGRSGAGRGLKPGRRGWDTTKSIPKLWDLHLKRPVRGARDASGASGGPSGLSGRVTWPPRE